MKLYTSKVWLTKKYVNDSMSPEEIAELCGVSRSTIYAKLKEFGLLRR